MARYTGAVRFNDGLLMYFVFNGTVDMARPRLFDTPGAADDAWGEDQSKQPIYAPTPDEEPVDVMPYFQHGSDEVWFSSTASRTARLITGPLSVDRADEVERATRMSPYS
jgi:hypothetical protein